MRLRTDDGGKGMLAFAGIGVGFVVFAIVVLIDELGRWHDEALAGSAMFGFWGTVIAIVALLRRRRGEHVVLDVPAGTVTWIKDNVPSVTVRFVELGDLSISKGELRGSGVPDLVLYRSTDPARLERRQRLITAMSGLSQLRELLHLMSPARDGAFRSAPDAVARARTLLPPDALATALAQYATSKDATLRTNAEQLQRELAQR